MLFNLKAPSPEMLAFMSQGGPACWQLAFDATVPLFTEQFGVTKQCGTGVLLRIVDKHFVITAAHTFDILKAAQIPLWIAGAEGDKLVALGKVTNRFSKTKDPVHREDDLFDIHVCELSEQVALQVARGHHFLNLSEIDPFDLVDPGSWYLVLGCPTAINESDMTAKKAFGHAVAIETFIYSGDEISNFDPEVQMALDFNSKTMMSDEGSKPVPHPGGISGCGIWRLAEAGSRTETWAPKSMKLVGIEHGTKKKGTVLIGTKVRFALQMIYEAHEDLRMIMNAHLQGRASFL